MTSLESVVPQSLRHVGGGGGGGLQPPQRLAASPSPNPSAPHPCSVSPVPISFHHHIQQPVVSASIKMEKPAMFGGRGSATTGSGNGGGGGAVTGSGSLSPPPVSSNPENNACKLIDYRGTKVAAFNVDGRELICLPQAFELFLKHLVGGLHTVYTKLKRLDVVPVVCNVEQVRVLRGLGAIQPGVNRCKLISPKEFDILYEDCTNSSARPGRPPKRSALAMTPDGLDKLKKNRLQMGSDFYSPTAANFIGDAKKSLGFGGNYLPFSDFQKSPLLTSGFHYPPAHLAHLAFMPLGHPGMMNLAMATHLSTMRDHLVSTAHDRTALAPEMTPTRNRGGGVAGPGGAADDRMAELRSSAADDHNNTNNNLSHPTTAITNTTSSSNKAAAAAAAAAMMMVIPPSQAPYNHHHHNHHRPLPLADAALDRPLNLEVQKKNCDALCRPPSNATDRDSSAGSSAGSDRNSAGGQLDLSKRSARPPALGNGAVSYSPDESQSYGHDLRQYGNDYRQYGSDAAVHFGARERRYGNDAMRSDEDDEEEEDDSADDRSDNDNDAAAAAAAAAALNLKGFPISASGRGVTNGDVRDKVTGQCPSPGYFLSTGAGSDMSTLETLLVNIQGLVKLAAEKACQKDQQITFERAEMKMRTTKDREMREILERQLLEERRKKTALQKKLRKERRARRSLVTRLQSVDRGQSHCYAPVTTGAHPQTPSNAPTSCVADCSGGSGGEGGVGGGYHDDRHRGVVLFTDNRRLRNASASGEDAIESEPDEGSCTSDNERRQEDRPNSIHSLMDSFITSAQKTSSSNGYSAPQIQSLKAGDTP